MSVIPYQLHPSLDPLALADRFAAQGRVRLSPFLDEASAWALRDHLLARGDWKKLINSGETVYELDRDTRAGFTPERESALDAAVYGNARDGFQYRFESVRVPDDEASRRQAADPLHDFAIWMAGGDARQLLRTVTGDDRIAFADAQATAYCPGDFLTAHDDLVAGKARIAAYVFGLTPVWRLEWGGLLTYHLAQDEAFEGVAPRFNTLDLFRVPQLHSVSLVSPAAACPRYSVTGWLREDQGKA